MLAAGPMSLPTITSMNPNATIIAIAERWPRSLGPD